MTMFDNFGAYYSDQNLCRQRGHGFTGLMSQLEQQGFRHQSSYYCYYKSAAAGCLLADLEDTVMAEDDSRTESVNEDAGPSYSKDVVRGDGDDGGSDQKGWLQLSIGGGGGGGGGGAAVGGHHNNGREDERGGGGGRVGLVELDLLPPGPSSGQACRPPPPSGVVEFRQPIPPPHFPLTNSVATPAAVGYISATPPYFLQPPGTSDVNWAIRPVMAIPPPTSSSSPFIYAPPLSASRFTPRPAAFPLLYAGVAAGAPSPSLDFRVIDPPRRPHSGIWFSLQASQNQAKEPFLPQISKSYLRIKDGSMTIRLVLKYLVNKLQLENESEIEIRCRGQELPPSLTLQHVRDEIWMNNNNEHHPFTTLLPHPSTSATTNHHVMVLLYGRKSSSSSTA